MEILNTACYKDVSGGDAATSCIGAAGAVVAAIGATSGFGLAAASLGFAAAAPACLQGFSNPNAQAVADNVCVTAMGDVGCGGGGGKVICTELCRNGVIEHDVWMADIRYSRENFSEQTMRGYHVWGIPYVKLMRKYPTFAKIAAYPTRWFAADIAYRMGVRTKPNYAGWAVRELAFRPICWTIGIVAKARDWRSLWAASSVGRAST